MSPHFKYVVTLSCEICVQETAMLIAQELREQTVTQDSSTENCSHRYKLPCEI